MKEILAIDFGGFKFMILESLEGRSSMMLISEWLNSSWETLCLVNTKWQVSW